MFFLGVFSLLLCMGVENELVEVIERLFLCGVIDSGLTGSWDCGASGCDVFLPNG